MKDYLNSYQPAYANSANASTANAKRPLPPTPTRPLRARRLGHRSTAPQLTAYPS